MTAIDFLQDCLQIHLTYEQQMQFEGLFQQAKEMHKQQIIDAYEQGERDGDWHPESGYNIEFLSSQDYYNETFNK